ncbi:MAG: AAA family ATPase, partial [bacterium]
SKGHVVFISGETGIGKTEVARIAARSFSKKEAAKGAEKGAETPKTTDKPTNAEPLLVRGYAGMSSEELFGHTVLTDRPEAKILNLTKDIEQALKVYTDKYPKSTKQDQADLVKGILTRSKVTTSEYLIGAVYLAAKEGRVVIIDEANYIPPELIGKLNDITTKRPGEPIYVQEGGIGDITVEKGFGIIYTGNINPPAGAGEQRYIGRYKFDASFFDRMSAIPYGYLPQAVQGNPNDYLPEQKQLFTIAMITALLPYRQPEAYTPAALLEKLESRHGTCFLPGGERGIDTVWKFSQFAAVTQQAFAGDIKDGQAHGFSLNGSSVGYQPSVSLSPRGVMRVIEAWRDDGFQVELDHYIAKHLLLRATDPKDQAYLYQLGKFFGFFSSEGWDKNPDYSASLEGRFSFKDPKNSSETPEVVPARESIKALYGEIPTRSEWPDKQVQKQATAQSNVIEWINLNTEFTAQLAECSSLTGEEFKLPT